MADINRDDLVGKELTWEQIQEYFPNQWVGLTNVVYEDNDGITIDRGVLRYIDKDQDELTEMAWDGKCVARFTTPDNVFKLGVIGGF